jgi:hypothetical protein
MCFFTVVTKPLTYSLPNLQSRDVIWVRPLNRNLIKIDKIIFFNVLKNGMKEWLVRVWLLG